MTDRIWRSNCSSQSVDPIATGCRCDRCSQCWPWILTRRPEPRDSVVAPVSRCSIPEDHSTALHTEQVGDGDAIAHQRHERWAGQGERRPLTVQTHIPPRDWPSASCKDEEPGSTTIQIDTVKRLEFEPTSAMHRSWEHGGIPLVLGREGLKRAVQSSTMAPASVVSRPSRRLPH